MGRRRPPSDPESSRDARVVEPGRHQERDLVLASGEGRGLNFDAESPELQHQHDVGPELDSRSLVKRSGLDPLPIDDDPVGGARVDHGHAAIETTEEAGVRAGESFAVQQARARGLSPDDSFATERDHTTASPNDPQARDRVAGRSQGAGLVHRGPALRRGAMLGRYAILAVVGAGSAGVVYRAYDTELERLVAIKVMHNELDVRHTGRLLDEARSLARVAHAHVVAVHDVGVAADRVFVVMRYVPGVTLRQFVRERAPSARTLQRLFVQVCEGLRAVHGAGLLHRDLKPDNVMVDAANAASIVDFGLALRRTAANAGAATASGTWRYMAPERRAGGPATTASDQYALCASFAEAAEGLRLGGRFRRAIQRGLRREPSERFVSIGALVEALQSPRLLPRLAKGTAITVALLPAVSLWHTPVVDGAASRDSLAAHPRLAAALHRIAPAPQSQTARAWALAEDAWWTSARMLTALEATEEPAQIRQRRACIRRVVQRLGARLDAHAELYPDDAAVASAIEDAGTATRCVEPWLPRHESPLPTDPEQVRRIAELRGGLEDVTAVAQIDPALALVRLGALEADAEALDFAPLWAEYLRVHGWLLHTTGKNTAAVPVLERAFFAALDAGETGEATRALDPLVHALVDVGRYAEARVWTRHALAEQVAEPRDPEQVVDRIAIAIQAALVARRLGDLDGARMQLQEATRWLPRATSSTGVEIYVNLERARFHLAADEPTLAIAAELDAVAATRAIAPPGAAMLQDMLVNLARTARRAGDVELARAVLAELAAMPQRLAPEYQVLAVLQSALLDFSVGDDYAAWDRIAPVLDLVDLPPPLAVPLRVLAFRLARRLGHRDSFVELDAALTAATAGGEGYVDQLRGEIADAVRDEGLCEFVRPSPCSGIARDLD